MVRRSLVAACTAVLIANLVGCGEPDKGPVAYKKGQYQGKPDARPWDSAPDGWSGVTWEKGNKTSWENAIKARSLSQNEYTRAE